MMPIVILFSVFVGARWPDATDQAQPCRPTIACTAEIVPPGGLEIEAGYMARRFAPSLWQQQTPLLFKLSLTTWAQAQIGTNGYTFDSAGSRYLDNLVLGGKFHLRDQSRFGPSLSVSAQISLPTFAGQRGYVRTDNVFLTVYVTKDFAFMHVDLNFGLNAWRIEGQQIVQAFAALAVSRSLPNRFGLEAEIHGFTDGQPIAAPDAGVLVAATFAAKPWFVFDIGSDASLLLYRGERQVSIFAGVTVLAAHLWDSQAKTP